MSPLFLWYEILFIPAILETDIYRNIADNVSWSSRIALIETGGSFPQIP